MRTKARDIGTSQAFLEVLNDAANQLLRMEPKKKFSGYVPDAEWASSSLTRGSSCSLPGETPGGDSRAWSGPRSLGDLCENKNRTPVTIYFAQFVFIINYTMRLNTKLSTWRLLKVPKSMAHSQPCSNNHSIDHIPGILCPHPILWIRMVGPTWVPMLWSKTGKRFNKLDHEDLTWLAMDTKVSVASK